MINYDNEFYSYNNNNNSNSCLQKLNVIKWFVSCLKVENNSIYRKNKENAKNFLESPNFQHNGCFFNGNDFFTNNFNINPGLYYSVPIHYLTRGKVFSPKKAKNSPENDFGNFLPSLQMRLEMPKDCGKILNFDRRIDIMDNNCQFTGPPISYKQSMCDPIQCPCLTESYSSLHYSSESSFWTPESDCKCSRADSSSYTPQSGYTPEVYKEQHANLTPTRIEPTPYIPVPNDLLDVAFAQWYNHNKIETEWSRMRKGVYKVEGKLVNLAMVKGELFVKILDDFSKRRYNMPISEYVRGAK